MSINHQNHKYVALSLVQNNNNETNFIDIKLIDLDSVGYESELPFLSFTFM